MVWGHSNFNDYCDILKTSTDTRLDISTYDMTLIKVIGRKYNQIVIDPVDHINTSQGIEDTPVGHIISHMGNTAPKHYLICDGTEYNISDYPYLAQHFKDEFGSYNYFGGDGVNTFAVPDLRGEFLRGTGTNLHTNQGSGANVGKHQDATNHVYWGYNKYNDLWVQSSTTNIDFYPRNIEMYTKNSIKTGLYWHATGTHTGDGVSYYTSRPTNTSVLYCIKYEPTYYMTVGEYTVQGFEDYSEEEKIVGRWIDGRPIYRKVITLGQEVLPTKNWTSRFSIPDSKELINVVIKTNDNTIRTSGALFRIENEYFKDWQLSEFCAYQTAIVEYTKSTDKENSFTPDMLSTIVISGNKQEDVTEEELNNLITDTINLLNE